MAEQTVMEAAKKYADNPEMSIAVSPSRILSGQNCLLQVKLVTLDKVFPFVRNDAMDRGTRVHNMFEASLLNPNLPLAKTADGDYTMWQSFIDTLRAIPGVQMQVEASYNFRQYGVYDPDKWAKGVENGGKIIMRMKIDAVFFFGDTAIIIDWKTGKRPKDEPLQLKMNTWAIMHCYPHVKRVIAMYVYVDCPQTAPIQTTYERSQLGRVRDDIAEAAQILQIANEDNHWPAMENHFCRSCPVTKHYCQYSKVGT